VSYGALLVTELDSGELVIQGRPYGPRVYLCPDDSVPLKQELAGAFGSSVLAAAGTVVTDEVLTDVSFVLPGQSVEPYWDRA
jgi:hypothetical protein